MATSTTGTSGNQLRIDRRQAMKAALGGAAAAVALSAPRIEGFSIVPDYAAASSQCPSGTAVEASHHLTKPSVRCSKVRCWGATEGKGVQCACRSAEVPGLAIVPVSSGAFRSPTVSARISGPVYHPEGRLEVTLTNFRLNEPYSSCTVTVKGTCKKHHVFVSTFPTAPLTANGSIAGSIYCSAKHTSQAFAHDKDVQRLETAEHTAEDGHKDDQQPKPLIDPETKEHPKTDEKANVDGRVTISTTCVCGPD